MGLNDGRQFWWWAKNMQRLWILAISDPHLSETFQKFFFYSTNNLIFKQIKKKSKNKAKKD